jgi:hypothetical protein
VYPIGKVCHATEAHFAIAQCRAAGQGTGQYLWSVQSADGDLAKAAYLSLTGTTGGAAPQPPTAQQNLPIGTPSEVPFQARIDVVWHIACLADMRFLVHDYPHDVVLQGIPAMPGCGHIAMQQLALYVCTYNSTWVPEPKGGAPLLPVAYVHHLLHVSLQETSAEQAFCEQVDRQDPVLTDACSGLELKPIHMRWAYCLLCREHSSCLSVYLFTLQGIFILFVYLFTLQGTFILWEAPATPSPAATG